jgi:threonyl-tRNA synthetase
MQFNQLHPEAKFGVGPAIEAGFTMILILIQSFQKKILKKLKKECWRFQREILHFQREELSKESN